MRVGRSLVDDVRTKYSFRRCPANDKTDDDGDCYRLVHICTKFGRLRNQQPAEPIPTRTLDV